MILFVSLCVLFVWAAIALAFMLVDVMCDIRREGWQRDDPVGIAFLSALLLILAILAGVILRGAWTLV